MFHGKTVPATEETPLENVVDGAYFSILSFSCNS